MESGLINLRAELLRKKAEVKKISVGKSNLPEKRSIPTLLKKPKCLISTVNKEAKGNTTGSDVCKENEYEKLEKSKAQLERKAALYDQLKTNVEVHEDPRLNQCFLVDFQSKVCSNAPNTIYNARSSSTEEIYSDVERDKNSEGIEEMHKKWNKIEEQTKQKKNIHYSDVMFDEARTHGAAFMKFSRDEDEREEQQKMLKELDREATEAAKNKQRENKSRKKQMERRLAKVRARKRLKMGLPVKDTDLDSGLLSESDEEGLSSEIEGNKDASKEENESIDKIDSVKPKTNSKKVREWDLGKPGVGSISIQNNLGGFKPGEEPFLTQRNQVCKPGAEHILYQANLGIKPASRSTLSQEEWIEERRKIRNPEFAPSSSIQGCETLHTFNKNSRKKK